jgi:hypothetical protein
MNVMLIYPPVAKPCEPPAGIARLTGFLRDNGVGVRTVDASLHGLLYLMKAGGSPSNDTWTSRASGRLNKNMAALKDIGTYQSAGRYTQAVTEIERVLWASGRQASADSTVSLADYHDKDLLPARSADLLFSAEHPEKNPFYGYYSRQIIPLIEEESPDIVGLSINYLSQALCAFALAGLIRRHFPSMRIALGGGLVTAWKGLPCWGNPFAGLIDDVAQGSGERFFSGIFEFKEVPERIEYGYRYTIEDLPDYLSPCRVIPFAASSACCWNKCSFCQERASAKEVYSCRPVQALKSLSEVINVHSPGLVHFVDSTIPPAFLRQLAMNPPGIPWYGFTRVAEELAERDFCTELRRSGCAMLKLGIESGDQHVLNMLNKGIDINLAAKALEALKSSGIATYVYLLFGTPEENHGSALKTLDFVRKNAASIDFINAAIFNLPAACSYEPGIIMRDFYEGDLSLYRDFAHPSGWDRKKARMFIDREFKRDASVSEILRKTPKVFTSNHAPFFSKALICDSALRAVFP